MSGTSAPDTEGMGVGAAQLEFSSWGWAFRGQDVKDYGIDAHVEPFDGRHRPAGRLLALQIKAGRRKYFRKAPAEGWWYYSDNNRHLRYWLGHVLPVVLVMYDEKDRILYWQDVTQDRVEYTDRGWKILIPRVQVVSADAADRLRAIADAATGASEDPVARSLAFLPPSAAAVLSQIQAVQPDGTMRLARLLAQGRHQPRLTVETILVAQPSWLPDGNGMFEAVIGAYANEHDHHDLALDAFTRAASYETADAGRLSAVAAVLALEQGDTDRAEQLVSQAADSGHDGLLLSVARAALADRLGGAALESPHAAEVLAAASPEELAAEPTLVAFLGEQAARRGDLTEAHSPVRGRSRGQPAVGHGATPARRGVSRSGGQRPVGARGQGPVASPEPGRRRAAGDAPVVRPE